MVETLGLRRWSAKIPGYLTLPLPDEVATWTSGAARAPLHAQKAIDALRDKWAIQVVPAPVMDGGATWVFAAREPDAGKRLLITIQRAYAEAWRFAECYFIQVDAAQRLRETVPGVRTAFERLIAAAAPIASDLKAHAVTIGDGEPQTFYDQLSALSMTIDNAENWARHHGNFGGAALLNLVHEPPRFWALRLAELFSVLFGKKAALHLTTDRERSDGTASPDALFQDFLDLACASVQWPLRQVPKSGEGQARSPSNYFSDDALRAIVRWQPTPKWFDRHLRLISETSQFNSRRLEYGDLPSVGIFIDVDADAATLPLKAL